MSIEIANIKKSFGRTQVLNDISLDIPSGQMVALLGPSGSGKPRCCALSPGWSIKPAAYSLPRHRREPPGTHVIVKVGFVFQHYALFRHMTVFDNIAFGPDGAAASRAPECRSHQSESDKIAGNGPALPIWRIRYPAQLFRRPETARGAGARAGCGTANSAA
ncbi:ATP-binding cassette domain-containing protein [Escherichia coli]|uniref:ATP-binding cassette domain-containing protein n=1 Tax=Escherichia coli TaxID=562 RepID=UPI000E05E3DA|nr:ATP-binding cassette domain-containing protein [Escherichia coli]STJ51875.1 sulfate ABC transporter, ATP-binding protein [Escherichia coli]